MDRIWTPWRFEYMSSIRQATGCVFCQLLAEDRDRDNLILLRKEHCFVVLNKFPYTAGHLMVVARRHVAGLSDATSEELSEMIGLARDCEAALQAAYQPDGLNVGFNLGKSAGAGVEDHLHLHLVPRWLGDTNFVTVIGETRTIPEELETTYEKLLPHLA